ncbi:MAG: alanyl-tRNA editing protein [Thermoplasmatota archaeon]
MKMNKDVDSALHVLKGAVQDVLGATLTTSVFADDLKGRLTVEMEYRPADDDMERVEESANDKIGENVPIEMFDMDREEAEMEYGDSIYDKFPVPDGIKLLTLTMIRDWNINCCRGPHHRRTGSVPRISISRWRHRPSRRELEISFELSR